MMPEENIPGGRLSELLLEAAPDAIVSIDSGGLVRFFNRQAEIAFGWSREEVLGRPIENLLPARFHDAHIQHRASFFQYPRIRPMGLGYDLWGLRKDGTEFPVEIALSPVVAPDGTQWAMATIRDVAAWQRNISAVEAHSRTDRLILSLAAIEVLMLVMLVVLTVRLW